MLNLLIFRAKKMKSPSFALNMVGRSALNVSTITHSKKIGLSLFPNALQDFVKKSLCFSSFFDKPFVNNVFVNQKLWNGCRKGLWEHKNSFYVKTLHTPKKNLKNTIKFTLKT